MPSHIPTQSRFPSPSHGRPCVVLAPMEGVTDPPMREFLSEKGGLDYCVTEFIRVSQEIPPRKTFREFCPELAAGAKTPAGTPVQVQLLGGDPEKLALSALRAVESGALAIDLNFGCPAPTVNRHDGGASLLKYPERIEKIVSSVRAALPAEIPLSAKLRLGWDDMNAIFENAERAEKGGASWITIHARTKVQGYIPPAHWSYIGQVRRALGIPVVANGEIWSRESFLRCREQTGCEHFMLGRGAVADPSLARQVAFELGLPAAPTVPYGVDRARWRRAVERFALLSAPHFPGSRGVVMRIKQWFRIANMPRPIPWLDTLKRQETLEGVLNSLSFTTQATGQN